MNLIIVLRRSRHVPIPLFLGYGGKRKNRWVEMMTMRPFAVYPAKVQVGVGFAFFAFFYCFQLPVPITMVNRELLKTRRLSTHSLSNA